MPVGHPRAITKPTVTVGLFADKLNRRAPTGVGAYIEHLSTALHRLSRHDYVLLATGEILESTGPDSTGRPPLAGITGPRRLVHGTWTCSHWPAIERLGAPRFDLLHVLVPSVPVPSRAPQVITVHDLTPLQFPACYRRSDRILFEVAVRRAAREARLIIAVSECVRSDVIELLGIPPGRVRTVHEAPPPALAPSTDVEIKSALMRHGLVAIPFVLFVGELTERKNQVPLVEAWAQLEGEMPHTRLVLAGAPGLGHEKLVRRIAELGQRKRVYMPGRISAIDLPALMSAANLFVMPSRYEGFGLPVLEAMTCGTPVVVSDGGALPEVAGDAARVVVGGETEGLAAAILELLLDETLAARLRRRGFAHARTFTWDRAARETANVYDEALAEN